MITLSDIQAARETIGDDLRRTPVFTATRLGDRCGISLWLKAETLQRTGSYKPRGTLNCVRNTPAEDLARGVITISAGNLAQAVAWAAHAAGASSTVVMMRGASESKLAATRGYGAEVIIIDGTALDAFDALMRLQQERGLKLIHPFDDPYLVAGYGTAGLEILEQVPDVDVIVCPIGGGGLISGIAVAVKTLKPSVRIYGVEPEGAPTMRRSWDEGAPVRLATLSTIADGLAAPMPGDICFQITRELVEDIVLLSDAEIAAGLRDVLTIAKLYVEPAGAAATAALLAGKIPVEPGERVVSLLSGGNLDLSRLVEILSGLEASTADRG
jgi:threonine dehydratase